MISNVLKRKSINTIVILNILGTFLYQGINFFLTPILTRCLGTYDFGLVTLYTTWVSFVTPIIGISTSIAIPYVKMNIEDKKQEGYLSSIIGLSLSSCVIYGVIVLIFLVPISEILGFKPIVIIMLYLQSFGTVFINFYISYCIQYQKTIKQFMTTIFLSIISSVLTISLLAIISKVEDKYLCRIFGFAIPYFFIGLIVIFSFFIKGKMYYSKEVWKNTTTLCLPIIFHSISHIILSQSDKVMIQNLLPNGISEAGIYGFAHTVSSVGSILWSALNNAWSPHYYKLLKNNELQEIQSSSNNYMRLYTSCFCIFYLVIPEFVSIMGGADFQQGIELIPSLYLGVYFVFLYSFPINYKTVYRQTLSIAIGTISAAICNITMNSIMIPSVGSIGASLASLISYILLFVFHQLTVKSNNNYNYRMSFYFKGIISIIVCTIIYYIFRSNYIVRYIIILIIVLSLLKDVIRRRSIF